MARLEDLIKDIADPRLRNQIAAEVGKLKARKKFGLVFEQHLPEIVQLPGLPVKLGARVVKRTDKSAGSHTGRDNRNRCTQICWSSGAMAARSRSIFSILTTNHAEMP